MKILKQSTRPNPEISLVLLDWSVRESFHLLHYLRRQTVSRDTFEVLVIEYYSRKSPALMKFESEVDTWVLLEMPESCYYHKHLMYNAGIVLSKGKIVVFCDSDAMVKETFIQSILHSFEEDPKIVLHLDQFRNMRRDFYPFNYPSFEEVIGRGCINNSGGKTKGVLDTRDPLHTRNYGACMCARREDLISIGGADEHVDYLGHICGPYDMTFRLMNYGSREIWHSREFLYHTWHPGQAGSGNYLGPHDGKHMSTTALEALATGRIMPYVENGAVRLLRQDASSTLQSLISRMVSQKRLTSWAFRSTSATIGKDVDKIIDYKGFRIRMDTGRYQARLIAEEDGVLLPDGMRLFLENDSVHGIKNLIDRETKGILQLIRFSTRFYILLWKAFGVSRRAFYILPWKVARATTRLALEAGNRISRLFKSVLVDCPPFLYLKVQGICEVLRRQRVESDVVSASMISLVVNLYYLNKSGTLRDRKAVVVMNSRGYFPLLRVLSYSRILPNFRMVKASGEIVEDLQHLVARNGELIFLTRDLYIAHFETLAKLRREQKLVVI